MNFKKFYSKKISLKISKADFIKSFLKLIKKID